MINSTVVIPKLPIGNATAVANMVRKCGGDAIITSNPQDLLEARKVILAGVGAFDAGMQALEQGNWLAPLHKLAREGDVPILGICLGMQLMCTNSEEGKLPGLGWFDATVQKIVPAQGSGLKVPHMGWNTVHLHRLNSLVNVENEGTRYYFVHSYHVVCKNSSDVLLTTEYGEHLTAAIQTEQLFGVQFHPEKSHRFGLALIKNFIIL